MRRHSCATLPQWPLGLPLDKRVGPTLIASYLYSANGYAHSQIYCKINAYARFIRIAFGSPNIFWLVISLTAHHLGLILTPTPNTYTAKAYMYKSNRKFVYLGLIRCIN